ncbi:MAG: response regulator [Acidobacteria bacterium]|nr:response regulator [Acidobacteriota bacterium]
MGRKLLLADDSITIQKVVNLTFADEGFEVTTVSNGDLAIEKIEELAPDIILADIHMPGLNGYEVCEFVKRSERFRHIPVMLLVGSFEPFNEAEARRVSADDYLTKPFQSIRQLVSKVGSLLSGKSSATEEEDSPTRDLAPPAQMSESEQDASQASQASTPLAPTAPLSEVSFGEETVSARREDFADPGLDDAMIEATPAGDFNLHHTINTTQRPTTPLSAADLKEAGINLNQPSAINMQDTLPMLAPEDESENERPPANSPNFSESHAAPSTSAERINQAQAADDALLDLGEIDSPSPATAEADDFVLDIWDESPARTTASETQAAIAEPSSSFADESHAIETPQASASEFVEAEVITAEPLVEAEPVEERAASVSSESASTDAPRTGQITLDQLSPEAIDAIARRAVEMLSEKVIEQIAWEVVPDLAERLIQRRLEQEGTKKQ